MRIDENQFLGGITENPGDQDLRLVFADWLEERNDPRSEFIRIQHEQECLGKYDPSQVVRESRAEDLLAMNEERWVGRIKQLVTRWKFRRGFVESVDVDVDSFRKNAAVLFQDAPVTRVRFLGREDEFLDDEDVMRLAGTPELARLREIELPHTGDKLSCEALETLFHSEYWPFGLDLWGFSRMGRGLIMRE